MSNNFSVELQAILNEAKTKANITNALKNIKDLSVKIDHLTLGKSALSDIKKALNNSNLSLNVNLNGDNIKQQTKNITENVNKELSNIKYKFDTGYYSAQFKAITSNLQKFSKDNSEAAAQIHSLNNSYKKLTYAAEKFSSAKKPEKLIQAQKQFQKEVDSSKNKVEELILSGSEVNIIKNTALSKNIGDWLQKNSKAAKMFGDKLSQMRSELNSADKVKFNNIKQQFEDIKSQALSAGLMGKSFKESFKNIASTFSMMFSTTSMIIRMSNLIKSGISAVHNLDTALIDLKKTTTMTNPQLEKFYYSANDVAKQMGVTTQEILSQASAWGRLGYSSAETATQMSKLSSQFKLISPGMTSDEATNGLVSVMKAYDIDADKVLDGIMSKINIIGNKFALSNSDIISMLQDSVSAMKDGNNTLEETIALETAAFEIVQDRSVGNGFKTAALRLRGLNEETQETDESLKNIQRDLYDLTGVSIMEDANTYKSTFQILKEISEVWDSLSDKTQANTLELMFGKLRANIGASVIKNFSAAEMAINEMSNSAGNANAEMSVAVDSIEYKLNKLRETGVGISQNIFNRDELKDGISVLTSFLEVIDNLIENFGIIPVVVGAAYAAIKGTSGGLITLN